MLKENIRKTGTISPGNIIAAGGGSETKEISKNIVGRTASLRFKKDRLNFAIYRGFIEKFGLCFEPR